MRLAERLYGAALLAYPRDYRRDRGPEMLEVLLQDGPRFSLVQALSLLRNGAFLRLRTTPAPGPWTAALAAAPTVVATLLTVVVITAVSDTAAQAAWTLHGGPGPVWVDPMWPVYLLWTATFVLLVRSRGRWAAATAWAAVAVQVAVLAGANGVEGRLDGYPGGAAGDVALLVPPLVLAVLTLRPARAGAGSVILGRRRLLVALAAGSATAVADAAVPGISTAWAPIAAAVALGVAMHRAAVLLRAGVVVGFAFVWVPLSGTAVAYNSGWFPYGTIEGLAAMAFTVSVTGAVLLTLVHLLELNGAPRALSRWPRRPPRDP